MAGSARMGDERQHHLAALLRVRISREGRKHLRREVPPLQKCERLVFVKGLRRLHACPKNCTLCGNLMLRNTFTTEATEFHRGKHTEEILTVEACARFRTRGALVATRPWPDRPPRPALENADNSPARCL